MSDEFKLSPVENPFSKLQSGISRQQRLSESIDYEIKRKREEEESTLRQQKALADRQAQEIQDEANKGIIDQAKAEGIADFVYEDERGQVKSALTPEQTEEARRMKFAEEAEKAEQEAATFRARDLSRELGGVKKNILTDYQRSKKEEELAKKRQALDMWNQEISEGKVDAKEAQADLDIINREIGTLSSELENDSTYRQKADEIQQGIWDAEDLRDGRPKGLPKAAPDDPEERKEFIESYAARATRLNSMQQRLSENAEIENKALNDRVNALKSEYDAFLANGVTPEQAAEQRNKLNQEISKATANYLQSRFEFSKGIREVEDESQELALIRPFVQEAIGAHNVWIEKQNAEAEAERERGRKMAEEEYDKQASDFSKYSPEAAADIQKAKDLLRNSNPKTKEEADAVSKEIIQLEKDASLKLQKNLEQSANLRQSFAESAINTAGNENMLAAIGKYGFEPVKLKSGKTIWKTGAYASDLVRDKEGGEAAASVAASIGQQIGIGLAKGIKAVQGKKPMVVSTAIAKYQQANNLTDDQMASVLDDIRKTYKEWDGKETTRTLNDGTIIFNPNSNILDKKIYTDAVNNSKAPDFIKRQMLDENVMDAYLTATAEKTRHALNLANSDSRFGISPDEWFKKHYGASKNPPPVAQWMAEYYAHHGKENAQGLEFAEGSLRRVANSFNIGGSKVAAGVLGLTGQIAGSRGIRDAAMDIQSDIDTRRLAQTEMAGHVAVVSDAAELVAEEILGVTVTLPAGGAGALIGKGLLSLSAKGAFGQAIKQGIVKGGTEFSKNFIEKSALYGMAAGSGLQSMALTYQDGYNQALQAEEKKLGRALSEDEKDGLIAREDIMGKAMAAGAIDFALTKAFGSTGVESIVGSLFGKGAKGHTVRDLFRAVGRKGLTDKEVYQRLWSATAGILKEGAKEIPEEALSGFLNTFTSDLDADLDVALKNAWDSGVAGLVLAGAIKTGTSAVSNGRNLDNVADPKIAIDLLKSTYGGNYNVLEVEKGLELLGYQPSKGTENPEIAIRNLKTAIDTNNQLQRQEDDAVSELERATDAGDKDRIRVAERSLKATRQARAILKVANGESIENLPMADQKAIRDNLTDGTPIVEEIDGEVIISDSAINMVAKMSPDAANHLINFTEGSRRKEIRERQEAKKQEGGKAGKAPVTAQEAAPAAAPAPEAAAAPAAEQAPQESAQQAAPAAAPITRKGGKPFGSEKNARRSIKDRGFNPDEFDYVPSEDGTGIVAIPKQQAAAPTEGEPAFQGGKQKSTATQAEVPTESLPADTQPMSGDSGAPSQVAPSGGKNVWNIRFRKGMEQTRTIQVEAGTKSEAIDKAIEQAEKGETVIPSMVEKASSAEAAAPAAPAAAPTPAPTAPSAETDTDTEEAPEEEVPATVEESFSGISYAPEKDLPKGKNWSLNDDGSITLKEGMSGEENQKAMIEAMAAHASSKALSAAEAKALYAALPQAVRQLIQKRASAKLGREVSEAEATQYMLTNFITDKVVSSSIKKAAKSNRKVLSAMLQFLREFSERIRRLIDKLGSDYAKKELQFYENAAIAILKESTSPEVLAQFGIALPETRISTVADATLPSNIRKTAAGSYEVLMPSGQWATARTLQDARGMNANKFEMKFKADMRRALALSATRGNISAEGVEDNLKLIERMIEAISGKVGISKEWFYASIQARFIGGDNTSILNAYSDAINNRSESSVDEIGNELQRRLRLLQNANTFAQEVSADQSISGDARRALVASKMSSVLAEIGQADSASLHGAMKSMNEFLALIGGEKASKAAANIKALAEEKAGYEAQLAGIAAENRISPMNGLPTKKVRRLTNKIKEADKKIETAIREAYSQVANKKTEVRGLAGAGETTGLLGFTESADASTVLHEFVHVLQALRDPRTGESIIDVALGAKGIAKVNQWISQVYPNATGYDQKEALAEAMESFLEQGGVSNTGLDAEFARVATAVAASYDGMKKKAGFNINSDVRGELGRLFAIEPLQSNALQSMKSRVQSMYEKMFGSVSFIGDDMVLPNLNGSKQIGTNKRKVAEKIADGLRNAYGEDVRVIESDGKFYAVTSRPSLGEALQSARVSAVANLQSGVDNADTTRKNAGDEQTTSSTDSEESNKKSEQRIGRLGESGGDRGGRQESRSSASTEDSPRSLEPLEGAPRIEGATGPDVNLVAVAEKYAKDNGIDHKRQSEYVKVNVELAKRIAQAYEEMEHAPNDPVVQEAYQNLIKQTKAQYQALVDAGYEFTFYDAKTDPYDGNPYGAMRDLRNNKRMAVYGTYDGYGTEGITQGALEGNPMLEDTGLKWKDQNGIERTVTANDLFRAVHDAFGHGLEGSGFRARGEENAWQAHVRLFTGSAVGAITSETRGQNTWLNFGPYGERNRDAKIEDTVFADQKTGLMPSWTWEEGRAGDMPALQGAKFDSRQEAKDFIDTKFGDAFAALGVDYVIRPFGNLAYFERSKQGSQVFFNSEDLSEYDTEQVAMISREEMIHAVSDKVITLKGYDYNKWHSDLFKLMEKEGLATPFATRVYPEEDAIRAAAEFKRAAIQRMLYGKTTEETIRKSKALQKIKAILDQVVDFFTKRAKALFKSKPEISEVFNETVRMIKEAESKIQLQGARNQDIIDRNEPTEDTYSNASGSLGSDFTSAYDVLRKVHGTDPNDARTLQEIKEQEAQALYEWSLKNDKTITPEFVKEFNEEQRKNGFLGGAESSVILKNGRAIKRNDAVLHFTWKEYFDRLMWHNRFFPETAYRFEGIRGVINGTTGKAAVQAYVSQPAIEFEARPADEERNLLPFLARDGWVAIDFDYYYHPEEDVLLMDLHGGNYGLIKQEKGNPERVAIIDPFIKKRQPFQFFTQESYIKDALKKMGFGKKGMPPIPTAEGVIADTEEEYRANVDAYNGRPSLQGERVQLQTSVKEAAHAIMFAPKNKYPAAKVAEALSKANPQFAEEVIRRMSEIHKTNFADLVRRITGQAPKRFIELPPEEGQKYNRTVEVENAGVEELIQWIKNMRSMDREGEVASADLSHRKMTPVDRVAARVVIGNQNDQAQFQAPKDAAEGAKRAAERMKKSASTMLGKWKNRDAKDASGKRVVQGDPSRANIDKDTGVRNAYDVSKEIYEENFIQQNWNQWMSDASKLLSVTPRSEIERQIFAAAEGLGNAGTPEFQIAAKRVVADRLQAAMTSGNQADIDYALALAQAEQEMRGEIARSMSAMRDPFMSVTQRTAYALGTAIHTAPKGQIDALKKKHGAKDGVVPPSKKKEYDEDVRKLQKARIEEAGKVLKRHGIDINDVFNSQGEGIAIGTKIDTDALATLPEKQKEVVRMMREGAEPKAIKAATGVEETAQVKAMEKYRQAVKADVEKLVAKGYTAKNIDSYAKGQLPPAGAKAGTAKDVEEIIDKSLSARKKQKEGFNINDPRHVFAAARALDDMDLDFITRTVGSWYANVFSVKTVMVNMLSLPFAGYRMIAERGAEAAINMIANNPEAKRMPEFKYIAKGMKEYFKMAMWQAYVAFDTEHAYFHSFVRGEGDPIKAAKGETHEDVRGYQMGHLLDYLDIGLEKLGVPMKRPSVVRRALGQKGANRNMQFGAAARGILRFNLGMDEFMRFIIAGGEVGAIAYRLGVAKGLKGAELEKFVTREMTVEGSSSWEMAGEEADISVFTKDLPSKKKGQISSLSTGLAAIMQVLDQGMKDWDQKLRSEKVVYTTTTSGMERLSNVARIEATRTGLALLRVTTMPFTRTLMNLLIQGFKRVPNPVSLAWSVAKVTKYVAFNRGESDPNIAKNIETMATQILSWSIGMALLGMFEGDDDDRTKEVLITGSMSKFGANAKGDREAAMREGMGPYRIRIGKGKNAITFDYGRIDPLAITLGTTVDWVREIKKNIRGEKTPWESGTTLLADTLAAQLTDKTMLRGLNDTLMMVSGKYDPQKWAARQLATVLVPNILRQPLRDSNTYYDASLDAKGMEGFAKALAYELYPNAEEKLGGTLPANPYAPPADRDAYGEKTKRPSTDPALTPINWMFRPMPYTPNRYDETVRRERRLNPGAEDIKMPGELAKSYTYENPMTGRKEKHKLTDKQYEIVQNIYRSVWRQERASVTDAKGLEEARNSASRLAWEIAKRNPTFQLEARKISNDKK